MKNNYSTFLYLTGLNKYEHCEDKIYQFILKSDLSQQLKSVGADYYFIDKQASLRKIAKQYLVTPERIRQILSKFIRMLSHPTRKEKILAELDDKLKALLTQRDELQKQLYAVNMELRQYSNLLSKGDFARHISELELSVRTHNALREKNITTVGDLISCDELDLLSIKNFGKKCLQEIKSILESEGLKLRNQ